MPNGEPYVVAAYLVFLALVLVYVAIMAVRLTRLQRDLVDMNRAAEEREIEAPVAPVERQPVSTS